MYPITIEQAWANIDRDLRGYFDFSEDDLAANQRGEISERQRQRLSARIQALKMENIVYTTISLMSIVATLIILKTWIVLLLIFVPMIYGYRRSIKLQKYALDRNNPNVLSVTGPAWRTHPVLVDRRYSSRNENDQLMIRDIVFKINPEQFFALYEDFIYTVYYLAASKFILSIECDRSNDLSREYVLQEVSEIK